MRPLRDYQQQALGDLRWSLKTGHKRPLLLCPTGGGKTLTAAAAIQSALDKGKRVAFCVPSIGLIDQTVDAFRAEGIHDIGVMQADHPGLNPEARVQVISEATLLRRQRPEVDLVFVDECHQVHKAILSWMADKPNLPFIGLSATPWTKGLGKYYDDLIVAAKMQELIDAKHLSPFRAYAPTHPDLSGVRDVGGDYHEGELAEVMSKPELTADVVANYLAKGENRPALCFGVNRAHAYQLYQDFERAGVPAAYVDAHTDRTQREAVKRAFHDGDIRVVCNIGTLTTGIDWDVRCLILARPTKSEALYQQIVGRALRTADGKDDALIFDHSDTTLRLGFVTDIHHDALDMGSRKTSKSSLKHEKPPKLPKECPSCHFVKPAGIHTCPECGFEPKRTSDVGTIDGDLVQLSGKKAPPVTMEVKQHWYGALIWIAKERHYKPGWAARKYHDKFGVWPANSMPERAEAPSTQVRNWVKSQQIAWAKGQQKGQSNAA
jgi:superfamily II DNA or RNA helicase